MRREEYTSSVADGNKNSHLTFRKKSFLDHFIDWFRNFLENAE